MFTFQSYSRKIKAVRPAIFILVNCQHDHVTCGRENNKRNVNSGMDKNADRSQEKSDHKAFAPAKAKTIETTLVWFKAIKLGLKPLLFLNQSDCQDFMA